MEALLACAAVSVVGQFQTPVSPSIPAETNPPPTISRYSERVDLLVAPHPGDAVMTTQTSCPWDGSGLSAWETVVGASSGTVTLPANTRVLLSASSLAAGARFEKIEVPATSALVFADEEISFSVKAFVVAGELLIGSPTCRVEGPIRITFFGSKSDGDTPLNGYGSKGLAGLPGSKVDIFGRRFYPTWSRLARIVRADDDRAYLQEAVNWYPGQEILLTTTIPDDTDLGQPNQNEVRVIRAVSSDGKVVQFTEPATYTHYAGTEYQGEVALLSRHVMLEGEPDADGFGGHLLVAGSNSRARIAGVATRYMGQTNVMARYPLHTHLMENQPDSYLSDNTLRDTYFRCVVIHGTHGLLNTENVAFNATGNCFYVEDGVEENNIISYNLAAYVKTIGKPAAGSAQGGERFTQAANPGGLTTEDTIQPADHSAAGFYFSNAYNRIIGNVASGGWSGFGFPGLPKPIGVYASKTDLEPQGRPLLEFRGNVVHSSGWYWGSGGCIYIGGQLTTESDGTLAYNSGRFSRHTRVEKEPGIADWEGTPVVQVFENTLLYGCNKGVLHWGNRVEIVTAEMHDVARAGTLFGEVWLTDAIVNGASGNVGAGFASKHHDGFQFYDVSVKSVVTNIEFRNYRRSDCRGVAIPGTTDWVQSDETCGVDGNVFIHNNAIWSGLYHSDEYKPEHISAVNKITYTNVDTDLVISFKRARNGASRMFNFIDFDGSATLEGRPTIVGSDVDFWNVCDDCRFSSDWQVWLCPKAPPGIPERHIAHIKVLTPDITPANGGVGQWFGGCTTFVDGTDYSACNVGHVALWGHGPRFGDAKRSMIITSNAGITGITGTGWWMWFDGGAPKKWQVRPAQVPAGSVVRLATNYPSGTTFAVRTWYLYNGEHNNDLTLAASLDDLWANPREKYYFDGTTLYLVPMMPVSLTNGYYEKGGARVYDVDNAFIIEAVADCAADSRGFCTVKPLDTVPSSTEACPARPTAAPGTAAPAAAQTGAPASAAPRTAAPATAAPSTAAPATAAPGTSAPGTGAPGTTAPATPAPGTAAPGTSAPGAPVTTAPATSAPMTTAPDTVAPGTPVTTAPATPAPGTAAPITAAPGTPVTTAPATSAPMTAAPDTVSPGAPVTTAPATSAPRTNAPDTAAPGTPVTTAPATSAPVTSTPDTLAPSTPGTTAPATAAPVTSAPDTVAPGTPATKAPATSAPLTNAPDTVAPGTPPTTAPASSAPSTKAPVTNAPATPVTTAPATSAPVTNAPATTAPATSAPMPSAPDTMAPATSAPATNAPATTAPATSAPMTSAPDTLAPATPLTTAPVTSAPATNAPDTNAPGTPITTAPATSAPVTDAPDTVPPGAPVTTAPATSAPATDAPSGVVNSTEAPVPSPEESDEEARTACLSLSEGASCGSAGEGKQCLSGVCRATERADEPGGGGGVESWVVPVLVAAGLAVLAACAAAGYTLAQKPKEIGFNEFMERIENASSSYSPALSPAATPTAMSPSETRSPMKFQV